MSFEYIFVWLVILLVVLCNFHSARSLATNALYLAATLLLIAMAGLRHGSVWSDYFNYQRYFNYSPTLGTFDFITQWLAYLPNVEFGWVFLGSLARAFALTYNQFIFLIAFFAVGLTALFYYKRTPFFAVALLVYYSHAFFYREMIQIRIGLVSAILLWVLNYVSKARYFKATLLFLLAFAMHYSAILALIPMTLFHFKVRPRMYTILGSLIVAYLLSYALDPALPIFAVFGRISVYQYSNYADALGIFSNPVTVKQVVGLIAAWWLVRRAGNRSVSPILELSLLSYFISTLWIIALNNFLIIAGRGATVLSIGEPLIFAELVTLVMTRRRSCPLKTILKVSVLSLAFASFFINIQIKKVVDDYSSIFSDDGPFE